MRRVALLEIGGTRAEYRAAAWWTWTVISVGLAAALAVAFFVEPSALSAMMPACEAKVRAGRECIACGLTTGFFAIVEGEWQRAQQINGAAVPLFAAFTINTFAWLLQAAIGRRR